MEGKWPEKNTTEGSKKTEDERIARGARERVIGEKHG